MTRSPGDPLLPHTSVLEENEPAAGVALWQILQDLTLWATALPDHRGSLLFNDEAGNLGDAIPELRIDLATLGALVRQGHPDSIPIIARVCGRVTTWAEEHGRIHTALEFAQAAALVDQNDASHALQVARHARSLADYARASVWFRRAAVLSRRSGDWESHARAYGGLGILHYLLGKLPDAIRFQERSIRIARRFSIREVQANALSDLSVFCYEAGDLQRGLLAAKQALRAYGPRHHKVLRLAHNTAVCWMDHHAAFRDSLIVLKELLSRSWLPVDWIRLAGNLGCAAGGVGDRALFNTALIEVTSRIQQFPECRTNADALAGLARGAFLLSENGLAARLAEQALNIATKRQEKRARLLAESILALSRSRGEGREALAASQSEAISNDVEGLAGAFVLALRRHPRKDDEEIQALTSAFISPEDPTCALQVARQARSNAEYERAGAWFRRAADLAEEARDYETSVRSLCGLANLYRQRGNLPAALTTHEEALSLTRMHAVPQVEGDVLLDLCMLRFEMNEEAQAFALARDAIKAYGRGHPKVGRLAHNVAVYLMDARGDYVNSLELFQGIEANSEWPASDQILLQANIVRASAGAGEISAFERAWERTRALLQKGHEQENHASALINLAHGALTLGRIGWAEIAARRAHQIAETRKESRIVMLAEDILEKISQAKKTRVRIRPFSDASHNAREAAILARELVEALRTRAPKHHRLRTPAGELPVE